MCNNCRNPLYCIVPPIILDRIARNGNEGQRDRALRTLSRDHSLRMARLHMAELRVVIRRGAPTTGTLEQTCGNKRRTIYDAQNGETLPGVVVRPEGTDSAGDVAVDEAYDGLGATYDFFWETFERDSIDDDGMPLEATVHFGEDYDNAFWNGVQMVFGDGDGELFNRFTSSLDVIGHELAHGVTEDEAGLIYWREPGALNESMSDVFGSLVKQKKLGQTAEEADWLIGAELLGPEVDGVALRSMSAPGTAYDDDVLGKDPQPGHMDDFVNTLSDNGGVHINSGIPNHAFYLVATALGSYAWERAGRIWYEALRDPQLRPNARFRAFGRATVTATSALYGPGGDEMKAVTHGWESVGIHI